MLLQLSQTSCILQNFQFVLVFTLVGPFMLSLYCSRINIYCINAKTLSFDRHRKINFISQCLIPSTLSIKTKTKWKTVNSEDAERQTNFSSEVCTYRKRKHCRKMDQQLFDRPKFSSVPLWCWVLQVPTFPQILCTINDQMDPGITQLKTFAL